MELLLKIGWGIICGEGRYYIYNFIWVKWSLKSFKSTSANSMLKSMLESLGDVILRAIIIA